MKSRIGRKAAFFLAGVLLMQAALAHAAPAEAVDRAPVLGEEEQAGLDAAPRAEAEGKPEASTEATPEVKPEAAPETEPGPRPESEAKPETVPETAPETKPEAAPEAAQEVKPEAAPEAEATVKPEVATEAESEVKPEPASETPKTGSQEMEPGTEASKTGSQEMEPGTEAPVGEAVTESLTEIASVSGEAKIREMEEKGAEKSVETSKDHGAGPSFLTEVSLQQDGHGAFYNYNRSANTSLELMLTDESGNQVGATCSLSAASAESVRVYFLDLAVNSFNLTKDDYGKTVKLTITAGKDGQSETKTTDEKITLTPPSLTLPSSVNISVLSKTEDLYDPTFVSGVSWTNGSSVTERIVQKKSGESWENVPNGRAFTSADAGVYRVHIVTNPDVDNGYYSNEVIVAVPVADLAFDGDGSIGSTITAKPVGPDGCDAKVQNIEWYYGDETALKGSEATFTSSLKDAVEAQTTSLRVSAKDLIGNTFTKYVTLKPLDLSKASLSFGSYTHPVYNGAGRLPEAALFLGDYEIPGGLYTPEPAANRNSVNPGEAWAKVTGSGTFLTGTGYASFVIDPAGTEDGSVVTEPVGTDAQVTQPVSPEKSETKKKKTEKKKTEKTKVETTDKKEPETREQKAQPLTASADLTVTDRNGKAAGYSAKDITIAGAGEAKRAWEVSADPLKREDGSAQTDESGKPVFRQRNLHLSPALLSAMAGRGETKVRFILGTAAVQLDISALDAAKTYTVRLAPLDEADLTGEEKAVLAAYAEDLSMFTVRIVRETDGTDMTDEIAAAGKLEILLADPGDGPFGILYLIEKRGQTQGRPASQVMDGTSETEAGRAWLKITAPGSGIFGLCSVG